MRAAECGWEITLLEFFLTMLTTLKHAFHAKRSAQLALVIQISEV
jgi:hypothetical protein